jgi:hypothetical protein
MHKTNRSKFFRVIDQIADSVCTTDNRINIRHIYQHYREYKESLPPETEEERKLRLDQECWEDIHAWDDALKQDDDALQLDLFDGERLFRIGSTDRIRAKNVTYQDFDDFCAWNASLFKNTAEAYEKRARRNRLIQENWDLRQHVFIKEVLEAMKRKGL